MNRKVPGVRIPSPPPVAFSKSHNPIKSEWACCGNVGTLAARMCSESAPPMLVRLGMRTSASPRWGLPAPGQRNLFPGQRGTRGRMTPRLLPACLPELKSRPRLYSMKPATGRVVPAARRGLQAVWTKEANQSSPLPSERAESPSCAPCSSSRLTGHPMHFSRHGTK